MLTGIVQNISLVPQKGKDAEQYTVQIALNDSLKTTYHKDLPFKQEMQGSAHITTESRRLIERFLDRFHDLLKNRG